MEETAPVSRTKDIPKMALTPGSTKTRVMCDPKRFVDDVEAELIIPPRSMPTSESLEGVEGRRV